MTVERRERAAINYRESSDEYSSGADNYAIEMEDSDEDFESEDEVELRPLKRQKKDKFTSASTTMLEYEEVIVEDIYQLTVPKTKANILLEDVENQSPFKLFMRLFGDGIQYLFDENIQRYSDHVCSLVSSNRPANFQPLVIQDIRSFFGSLFLMDI